MGPRPDDQYESSALSGSTRLMLRIGFGLLVMGVAGLLASRWLLDFIFLPLGNYLHPEWDPPVNFLMPIHWLWATVMALLITGAACLAVMLLLRYARRRKAM